VKLLEIVAENLRQFRKQKNLTQEAVGYKAHVNPAYLSRVELGQDNVSIVTLEKLAKAMKVDPFLLLIPKGWMQEVEIVQKPDTKR
jgi:transcriptional regulator with XRE-family HTH domain